MLVVANGNRPDLVAGAKNCVGTANHGFNYEFRGDKFDEFLNRDVTITVTFVNLGASLPNPVNIRLLFLFFLRILISLLLFVGCCDEDTANRTSRSTAAGKSKNKYFSSCLSTNNHQINFRRWRRQ